MNLDDIDFTMGAVISIPDPSDPWNDILISNPLLTSCSEIGSLDEYISGHFFGAIEDYLKDSFYCMGIPIGKPLTRINHPEHVFVEKMEQIRRSFVFVDRSTVQIRTLYRLELKAVESTGRGCGYEEFEQWYEAIGYAIFNEDGQDIIPISEVVVYDKKLKAPSELLLSAYLVPIIYKENLDATAQRLLLKYYPEILQQPTALDVFALAEKLGLTIEYIRLAMDDSILGKFIFQDDSITVFDDEGMPQDLRVSANTILVDCVANCNGNQHRIRGTILHEIIHYLLHSLFFQLQHMYNDELRCFSCKTSSDYTDKSPLYWVEWHAQELGPRMFMPMQTTLAKIDQLRKKYSTWHIGHLEMTERIIKDLAVFFGVSQQCAKFRMIELGFPEARGCLNYVNGKYIPSYNTTGQIPNQTFSISMDEVIYLYSRVPDFAKTLSDGRFIYVESHFCLNDSKYIRFKNGKPELTSYARHHIRECCLAFTIQAPPDRKDDIPYYEGCLMREQPLAAHVIGFDCANSENSDVIIKADNPTDFSMRIFGIMKDLPGTFSKTLVAHMNRLEISKTDLAKYSGISADTIQNYRNDTESNLQLSTVIALCIGLHLEPTLSLDLIAKAGFSFRANKTHIMYQLIITSFYMMDIYYCNDMLVSSGLKPLGKAA